ncbi:MAG: DUF4440 domain-containing protein [Hyphomicrobiaceae bacterium]
MRPRTLSAVLAGFMLVAGLAAPEALRAHPPAIINEAGERALGEEIQAFRKALADAIAAKDAKRLRDMYAPSFTHTHTTGNTDNRDARIVSALAGEPVIETAEVTDLVVRAPNDWVAVVTGTSPIKSLADGKTYAVKWLQVFTRNEKSWVLVASQATRAGEIKP